MLVKAVTWNSKRNGIRVKWKLDFHRKIFFLPSLRCASTANGAKVCRWLVILISDETKWPTNEWWLFNYRFLLLCNAKWQSRSRFCEMEAADRSFAPIKQIFSLLNLIKLMKMDRETKEMRLLESRICWDGGRFNNKHRLDKMKSKRKLIKQTNGEGKWGVSFEM